jgi:hypothetical protein
MFEGEEMSTDFWEGYEPEPDSTCNNTLRTQGKAYPRTCKKCGLGPCIALANAALDKKAENARELGLDYEPVQDWKWHQAPVKTSWGHDMVVADLAIDKDNTVSVYCERDQTAKVEAMFTPPAAPDLQAELDATNRQVEILSDALAESRREVARLKAVQPVAQCTNSDTWNCKYCRKTETCEALKDTRNFATPPAAAPVQEPVAITEQMAFAFHNAITDGAIGTDDLMEIMRGLEAAFAYITTPPAQPAPVQVLQRYSPDGEGGMEVDSLGAYVKHQDVTTPPAAQRPDVDALVALARADEREASNKERQQYADWLDEAAADIEDWGMYASEYLQKKWDLPDQVQDYKNRAAAIRARSCPPCNEDCDQGRNCPARKDK